MHSIQSCRRLTRVITDDGCGIEAAQLHCAMQAIQRALGDIPAAERGYVVGALLSLAVARIVEAGAGSRFRPCAARASDVASANGMSSAE